MKTGIQRTLALVLALLTLLACAVLPASAASGVKVTVDGRNVSFNSNLGSPYINENGRTMVPFRAVANFMDGVSVEWDDGSKCAIFRKTVPYQSSGGQVTSFEVRVLFPIGTNQVWSGVTTYRADGSVYAAYDRFTQMDTLSAVRSGRTYAPIRYLAENLGYTVGWNNGSRTVTLTSPSGDWAKAFVQAENRKGYDNIVSNDYEARQYAYIFARHGYDDLNPTIRDVGEDVMQSGTHIWRFKYNAHGVDLYITQDGKTFYSLDGGKNYEQW